MRLEETSPFLGEKKAFLKLFSSEKRFFKKA
jgi:hypothetical protein